VWQFIQVKAFRLVGAPDPVAERAKAKAAAALAAAAAATEAGTL
jgi:hypothetical protein